METSKVSCAEEDTMYSMPMVEVSGPQGSTLVFRPLISSEISAASQHLLNPTASAQTFAKELITFCQDFKPTMSELRRVLILKMKPTEWHKIADQLQNTELRCNHVDWKHDSNALYREAVNNICTAITKAFPASIDTDKIQSCKQRHTEDPEEFPHTFNRSI
ncbi:hypothetical protein NQD34_018414 [Periophthalmus magnuspinnatus]|nr:hypothetical protein NQD34_018414 [Periophthalmus magnuspinnatus]